MMQGNTVVRPYAEAAFETSNQAGSTEAWLSYLSSLTQALEIDHMKQWLSHPQLTPRMVADILVETLKDQGVKDAVFIRFVELLALYNRVLLLPELLTELQVLIDHSKNQIHVLIESAFKLSDQTRDKLMCWLEKKYNKKIVAEFLVRSDLIGGALVRVGDQVIDMSVRGQLERLKRQLVS